ncbi:MAG: hypothetical protein IJW40_12230 [Clostridia bacterium]|nr:hypothetical protein [Clostridia bacterium]MBQ7339201.1 hypothetical protein [Clostridia bacterium]
MKFQLDRWLYIKSADFGKALLWRGGIVVLYVVMITLSGSSIEESIFVWLAIFMIGWTVMDVLQNPKEFTLQNGELHAVQYIRKYYPHGIRVNRSRSRMVRAFATVTEINRVQYRRHSGNVTGGTTRADFRVMGHIVLRDRKGETIDPELISGSYDAVELYGVKDMEGAISALRAVYPEAVFQELTTPS